MSIQVNYITSVAFGAVYKGRVLWYEDLASANAVRSIEQFNIRSV